MGWSSQGSIKGPAGNDGRTWHHTTGSPSGGLGANGDYAVDIENAYIWGPKTGGAWGNARSIEGPAGSPGDPGPVGDPGPAGASGSAGGSKYRPLATGAAVGGSSMPRGVVAGLATANGLSTWAALANYLIYVPVYNANTATLQDLRFNVTVAGTGGSTAKVALYQNIAGNQPYPGAQAYVSAAIATDATGLKTAVPGSTVTLAADTMYWAAITCTSTPTLRAVANGAGSMLLGYDANMGSSAHVAWYVTGTATPPATADTGTSMLPFNGACPAIMLTYAS